MSLPSVLGLLTLFVGVPLNLYILVQLVILHREEPTAVLRVLIVVWVLVLSTALVFGLVFVNNDMGKPVLSTDATKVITRTATLALVIVPAIVLRWAYRER